MRRLAIAAALALIAAPAFAAGNGCPQGLKPATTAEMFFSQDLADGRQIDAADWRAFVGDEVRPRFPASLTADVYGQDRDPKSAFQRESSKAVFLVLTGAPDERHRLDLIHAAYQRRFHQDSVLLVEQKACATF